MTDIEICQREMLYPLSTPPGVSPVSLARAGELKRITPMTIEVMYLTAQIQRWLNQQVARHLAAQAERLEPVRH
jgi:hypothetical protein